MNLAPPHDMLKSHHLTDQTCLMINIGPFMR